MVTYAQSIARGVNVTGVTTVTTVTPFRGISILIASTMSVARVSACVSKRRQYFYSIICPEFVRNTITYYRVEKRDIGLIAA